MSVSYPLQTARPPVHPPSKYASLILPIFPPPSRALDPLPVLTEAQRTAEFKTGWIRTTHLVPSAYLRSTSPAHSGPPPPATESDSKEERKAANSARAKWVQTVAESPRGRHERVLWNVVNRYARKELSEEDQGITLVVGHANGFPKEIWEPALLDLLSLPSGQIISEIWAWEAAHHGASYQLNLSRGVPWAACEWADDTRDFLNFFLHFLPSEPASAELPVHLPVVAPTESALRKVRGFSSRKIFLAGHSVNGCCSAWAAIIHPRLFTSIVLIDPVIVRQLEPVELAEAEKNPEPSLAEGAVARRDLWPSRDAALKSFSANPFFAGWDPRVLSAYVTYGLVATKPGGPVTLAMPALQEALVFEGTRTSAPAWDLLHTLDPRLPIRFLIPGEDKSGGIGGEAATRERVWLRPVNASNIRIKTAGHLIVQEAPADVARELNAVIAQEVSGTRAKL
ncbi:unnamed protein product [Mycena citricolor]|uniref:AB hydrolase-1 domain-containing protein n=1 Tax=Mycena citricolor TaxID=2018698 RepID=A0AAD2HM38_9AGAR|nr:unnamed protein product [Mycena citricolor]